MQRKKKLLFVIPSLTSGGGERSLVNLLNQIDGDAYDIDLFILNPQGIFMELIPPHVRVLELPRRYRRFMLPLPKAVLSLIAAGRPVLACRRLLFSLANRRRGNDSVKEQRSWKHLAPFFDVQDQVYDTAIGFLEKTSIYFCVDKVNAASKIGWIHNDYDELGMDASLDRPYFERLLYLVTVSEECASKLEKRFPEYRSKVRVIHNIVSPAVIRQLASQRPADDERPSGEEISILTIGRLHPQKALDLAIEACAELVSRGFNIRWNVIGEGEERQKLTELIASRGLQDRFRLLGLRSNPYPYIESADLYVQTSRFEGKSIAIDEAKILHKPIVVTNFSTAADQIRHEVDGLIAEMDAASVAAAVARLIEDKELRAALSGNLRRMDLGTEDEVFKFYNLLA